MKEQIIHEQLKNKTLESVYKRWIPVKLYPLRQYVKLKKFKVYIREINLKPYFSEVRDNKKLDYYLIDIKDFQNFKMEK